MGARERVTHPSYAVPEHNGEGWAGEGWAKRVALCRGHAHAALCCSISATKRLKR